MSLKLDLCNFSGYKIYPSCGIRLARTDGKIYNFVSKKARNAYLMKKNPRKIAWTVLYRRKMKKGTEQDVTKKRARKTTKFQRSIQGATLENILAKRNQKPEVRKAQREQVIRSQKEKIKAKKEAKASNKKKTDTKAVRAAQKKINKANTKSRPGRTGVMM